MQIVRIITHELQIGIGVLVEKKWRAVIRYGLVQCLFIQTKMLIH